MPPPPPADGPATPNTPVVARLKLAALTRDAPSSPVLTTTTMCTTTTTTTTTTMRPARDATSAAHTADRADGPGKREKEKVEKVSSPSHSGRSAIRRHKTQEGMLQLDARPASPRIKSALSAQAERLVNIISDDLGRWPKATETGTVIRGAVKDDEGEMFNDFIIPLVERACQQAAMTRLYQRMEDAVLKSGILAGRFAVIFENKVNANRGVRSGLTGEAVVTTVDSTDLLEDPAAKAALEAIVTPVLDALCGKERRLSHSPVPAELLDFVFKVDEQMQAWESALRASAASQQQGLPKGLLELGEWRVLRRSVVNALVVIRGLAAGLRKRHAEDEDAGSSAVLLKALANHFLKALKNHALLDLILDCPRKERELVAAAASFNYKSLPPRSDSGRLDSLSLSPRAKASKTSFTVNPDRMTKREARVASFLSDTGVQRLIDKLPKGSPELLRLIGLKHVLAAAARTEQRFNQAVLLRETQRVFAQFVLEQASEGTPVSDDFLRVKAGIDQMKAAKEKRPPPGDAKGAEKQD